MLKQILNTVNQMAEKLNETNIKVEDTSKKLDETIIKVDETSKKLDETNIKLDDTIKKVEETNIKLDFTRNTRTSKKCYKLKSLKYTYILIAYFKLNISI